MLHRIITLAVLLPHMLFAQHKITGTFSPSGDYTMVLLYKVTPTISEYINNAKVNEKGVFEFQLDSTATKGMYRIVYAVPQEDYNFDVIYSGKEDIELSFNSETGVKFLKSSENRMLESYTNSMSMITGSIGKFYREDGENAKALKAIFKTQRDAQSSFEDLSKETLAHPFILNNKRYIPNTFLDEKSYADSLRVHYFDHIDFNSTALQSSGFLEEKMLNYIFGVTQESLTEAENYKINIDTFYNEVKNISPQIKRILLVDVWEQMRDLGFDNVANYISDTYLLAIAKSLNDTALVEELTLFKNTSIGQKAPDFSFDVLKNNQPITTTLSNFNSADTYILVFWSSVCSHCLKEMPKLYKFTRPKTHVKVLAIGLESEPYPWKDVIFSYPNFIHIYGEGKWDNAIGNKYAVKATPTYFILNKDKEIIRKPSNFEALKAFVEDSTQ